MLLVNINAGLLSIFCMLLGGRHHTLYSGNSAEGQCTCC